MSIKSAPSSMMHIFLLCDCYICHQDMLHVNDAWFYLLYNNNNNNFPDIWVS